MTKLGFMTWESVKYTIPEGKRSYEMCILQEVELLLGVCDASLPAGGMMLHAYKVKI